MTRNDIVDALHALNNTLSERSVKGEICIYGGAAMCLVYNARPSTKDVDAVFEPADVIRKAALEVAQSRGLPEDWLNDAVKGFLEKHSKRILMSFSHLKIYVPEPDYLLAMKALASRVDGADKGDILLLIRNMGLQSPDEVFKVLEKYYPLRRIRPATQFFIEELFEK